MKINWNKKYTTISLYACAVLALTIIGIAICFYLPEIFGAVGAFLYLTAPIFYGLALAYLISPLLSLVEKRIMKYVDRRKRSPYIKRIICLFVTYVLLSFIIALFGFLIFPELIRNYDSISHNISENIQNLVAWFSGFLSRTFGITINTSGDGLQNVIDFVVGYLGSFGSRFGRWVVNFLIGLFLSFFILLHTEQLKQGFKKLLAALLSPKIYNGTLRTVHMADRIFGRFFVGKIFDSLIIGVIMLALLGILQLPLFPAAFHMPYFLLISAVICITNIIPYIGPIIGAVPCVLLVFIDNEGGFARAFILLVIIIAVQTLDGNVIGPKILGKTIGISSLWVVVSIIIGGNFFGIIGMFIAVPLFTVIYNLTKDMVNRRLEKKNLSTETAQYVPVDTPTDSFSWDMNTSPEPNPDLLSDSLDDGNVEDLDRKHRTPKNTSKGGDRT